MEIAGLRPSIASTSGFSILPKTDEHRLTNSPHNDVVPPHRGYQRPDWISWTWQAGHTTSLSRGISTSIFFKLWARAPWIQFYLASLFFLVHCCHYTKKSEILLPKRLFYSIIVRCKNHWNNEERIRDMKQVFLSTTTEFKEIDTLELGTWINLVNPTQMNPSKSLTPSISILPTFEHRSMRKKCLVLRLKTSIPDYRWRSHHRGKK